MISANVTLSGFTLSAARPAFTYGIVAEGGTGPAGTVTLRIDVAWYSFAPEYDWTRRASCMHQVDPRTPQLQPHSLDYAARILREIYK